MAHTGYAFADAGAARDWLTALAPTVPAMAEGAILNRLTAPNVERIGDLPLGEEAQVWRAGASSPVAPEPDAVVWAIAVRRGAAVFVLTVDGTGAAPDALARELAQRLDRRLTAAQMAWP
jgi:hypothetical protein